MPNMTLQQAFDLALRHQHEGRLREAEQLYRQILLYAPDHAESLHLLGVVAAESGRPEEAVALIRRAAQISPSAQYLSNLGVILGNQRKFDEAMAAHRQALAIDPDYIDARANLASTLTDAGRAGEALDEYKQVLSLRSDWPEAHNGLANALLAAGRLDEAIDAYRRALALRPEYPEALSNLSNALRLKGDIAGAVAAARKAIALRPNYAAAYNNLGTALHLTGSADEAIASYRQAVALDPNAVLSLYNLGGALQDCGRLEEAIGFYTKALALREDFAEIHGNLGNALKDMGRIDDALASYRRALSLKSETKAAHNLLFGIHFHPDWGPREILEEHLRWARVYAEPLAQTIVPHENPGAPGLARRLRVGFVSPDFTVHPVGRFLLPLLENLDRQAIEVFCYSDVRRPDEMTERLQAQADVWRSILFVPDEEAAARIRADRIDILVDLVMHADGSRLLLFARKPAPVQATYLAYCSTTGLSTMDYRLSDPFLDPIGVDESIYSEKTVRLPHTYWCYPPPDGTPEVGPLPAESSGRITFGCLNNFAKVSEPALKTWCKLLRSVPGSRLLVFSREGPHRQRALELVAREGIEPGRFQFVGAVPTPQYFERYQQIDIALDPFPFGGGTTTCDALWMGVPVVSLAGRTAVSRAGSSILSNVGLPDLVAHDTEEYLRIARELATELPRLSELRSSLRPRMRASPLMDAPAFARGFEAACRQMWREYCASAAVSSPPGGEASWKR
ncbi:MAG TPA: tetratricopeptide repeat protein [Tepidisphaeraceae bacterium]|nr:tetratricopeptide repeat protein [Tepidisphaeraceae bacterium]